MLLTQRNILYPSSEDKQILDLLSYHSARLYNSCTYNIRQYYFNNNAYLQFKEQYHEIKDNENFSLLINDSAQQVLRMVDKNFKSFFSLLKLKQKGKYSADINVPYYLNKDTGWSIFIQGRSARIKKDGIYIGLSKNFREKYNINKKDIIVPVPKNIKHISKLQQLQIKPTYGGKQYEIFYTYEAGEDNKTLNLSNAIGVDCGLNNLLTTYNPNNGESLIIDGKKLKSVNHHFNKTKAKLQETYDKNGIKDINTKRFIKLSQKRKNIINDYFNRSVKSLIDYCIANDIGTIVIGDFKGIKNEINMGKTNNQNFVSIPYGILKRKLEAKCEYYGINYVLQEESYTSKCSSLDLEPIVKKENYSGKRVNRGLYKTNNGKLVNADVNGACNILRKYKGKSDSDLSDTDVSGVVNHPRRSYLQKPSPLGEG